MLILVTRHFKKNSLRFTVYHGSLRQKDTDLLSSFDIVLTTYDTIRTENPQLDAHSQRQGVIQSIIWHRVVLDEGRRHPFVPLRNLWELNANYLLQYSPLHPESLLEEVSDGLRLTGTASLVFNRNANPEPT